MANTRGLKARIIRQIRALEADLRAIERVEEIERRQAASQAANGENGDGEQPGGKSLIGTVEHLLAEDWTSVSGYLSLVRAARPNASRAAVSTALQRLTDRGVAEAKGERRVGYEYKRKGQ